MILPTQKEISMEQSTFDQVVTDDVVLELESIAIDEDSDTSDSMRYSPRRDVGH